MKTRKKRGQTELRNIVLVLIVAVILISIGFMLYGKLRESGDREVCRLSAEYKTALKIRGQDWTNTALKCTTQELAIKNDGIYKNGKIIGQLSLRKINSGEDEKRNAEIAITKAIADEMYDCWYQFRGLDPFGHETSALRCVPCATITFEHEISQAIPYIPRFYTTLKTFKDDSGADYLSYLAREKIGFEPMADDVNLTTAEDYAIVYETSKENKLLSQVPFLGPFIAAPTEAKTSRILTEGQGLLTAQTAVAAGATAAAAGTALLDLAGAEQIIRITMAGDTIDYVWDGTKYLMDGVPVEASAVQTNIKSILSASTQSKPLQSLEIIINKQTVTTIKGGASELAPYLDDIARAATAAETGGVAVSGGFGGLLAKAVPKGTLARIAPRLLGTTLQYAGKAVAVVGFLYIGYDLLQPEKQAVSGVEIAPLRESAEMCEQFY